MGGVQRGRSNEHRTIRFLQKRNYVAIRAAASKGTGDIDVLAYHLHTGHVKHIQSKSNGKYSQADLQVLRVFRDVATASNLSIEVWDWYDGDREPVITVIRKDGESLGPVRIGALECFPLSQFYTL